MMLENLLFGILVSLALPVLVYMGLIILLPKDIRNNKTIGGVALLTFGVTVFFVLVSSFNTYGPRLELDKTQVYDGPDGVHVEKTDQDLFGSENQWERWDRAYQEHDHRKTLDY